MKSTPEQLSELCLACGMCCDGTLFGKAHIKDADEFDRLKALGMSTLYEDANASFTQPCPQYHGSCKIYRTAPSVCSNYYCLPLRKLKRGATSFSETEKTIRQAGSLKRQFLDSCPKTPEFSGKSIFEIKQYLNMKERPLPEQIRMRKEHAHLYLLGLKLQLLLIGDENK